MAFNRNIYEGHMVGDYLVNHITDENFNAVPSLDSKYGPYSSVTEAEETIKYNTRAIGLTVGIIEEKDNLDFDSSKPEDSETNPKKIKVIEEYWWKKSIEDVLDENGNRIGTNLVKKGGGGKAVEISYEDTYNLLPKEDENVQKAIDKLMGKVFYVLPSVRFTNISSRTEEIGNKINITSPIIWSFGGGTGNITGQIYHIGSNTAVTETNSFDKLTTLQEHATEITTNKIFSVTLKYNDANGKPQLNISTTVSYNFYSKWFYKNISSKNNIPTTEVAIRALMTNPPYTYTKNFKTDNSSTVNTFVVAIPNTMHIIKAITSNNETITSSADGTTGFCKYTWKDGDITKDSVTFVNGIIYNVYFFSPASASTFGIDLTIN